MYVAEWCAFLSRREGGEYKVGRYKPTRQGKQLYKYQKNLINGHSQFIVTPHLAAT